MVSPLHGFDLFVITSSSPSTIFCGLSARSGRRLPETFRRAVARCLAASPPRQCGRFCWRARRRRPWPAFAPASRAPIPLPSSRDRGHGERMATAPAINNDLMYLSPRLLIAAEPLLAAAGVLPGDQADPRRQVAARSEDRGSATVAASALATSGPTPGTLASRRRTEFAPMHRPRALRPCDRALRSPPTGPRRVQDRPRQSGKACARPIWRRSLGRRCAILAGATMPNSAHVARRRWRAGALADYQHTRPCSISPHC